MRKNYEKAYARHELSAYTVGFGESVGEELRAAIAQRLGGFGARVVESGANYVLANG